MARVLTESNQNITGRIGDVVYVRYKGGIYIRKASKKRRDAHEPKMVLNQQRFTHITRFCTQFKQTLIPQIWNDAAKKGSGYNFFMKANSPAFARDGSIAEPLLLKFSVGDLLMPEELTAQRIAPESNILQVSWKKNTHMTGTRAIDELMCITSDGELFSPITTTGLIRKDLQGSFNLPVMPASAGYIYLFFRTEDRRMFSDSIVFKI